MLTPEISNILKEISTVTNSLGVKAYVVGGFVRDYYLNKPNHDIDIVVIGSGTDVATAVAKHFGVEVKVYKSYGTAQFVYNDNEIEFVGARREFYHRESRKPIVENGTLEDDLLRRDFTINAMALSLQKDSYMELIDMFNGMSDLKNKILKTPTDPNITFSDDPLRMLRAVRFATRLDFEIDSAALSAMKANANRMDILSKERISGEFNKTLMTKKPSGGLKILRECNMLKFILPNSKLLNDNQETFDNVAYTVDVISSYDETLWMRWAGLMENEAKETIENIFKYLTISIDNMNYVTALVEMKRKFESSKSMSDSDIRRSTYQARNIIDDVIKLCDITKTPINDKLKNKEYKNLLGFTSPLSGNDIINILKIQPGKNVGILKSYIDNSIIDGEIPNDYGTAVYALKKKAKELGII